MPAGLGAGAGLDVRLPDGSVSRIRVPEGAGAGSWVQVRHTRRAAAACRHLLAACGQLGAGEAGGGVRWTRGARQHTPQGQSVVVREPDAVTRTGLCIGMMYWRGPVRRDGRWRAERRGGDAHAGSPGSAQTVHPAEAASRLPPKQCIRGSEPVGSGSPGRRPGMRVAAAAS